MQFMSIGASPAPGGASDVVAEIFPVGHGKLVGDEVVLIFWKFTDGIRHVVEPVFFALEDMEASGLRPFAHNGDRLECGGASDAVVVLRGDNGFCDADDVYRREDIRLRVETGISLEMPQRFLSAEGGCPR